MTACNMCGPIASRQPGKICDSCFEIAWEIVVANRRRFQKLIDDGAAGPWRTRS